MAPYIPVLLGVIGLFGGGGGVWSMVNVRTTRSRMIADAERVQADTAAALGTFAVDVLLKPLRERIGELEREVEQLRAQVREAREAEEEVARLKRQIRQRETEIEQLEATVAVLRADRPDRRA